MLCPDPIDHDDGSCYYIDTYNVQFYGGKKNFRQTIRQCTNTETPRLDRFTYRLTQA